MTVHVAGRTVPLDPRAAARAVRAELAAMPPGLRRWFIGLAVLMFVGAAAAARSLIPGDKGLATTPTVEWGVLIVGYVFFAITTSGLCLASSLGTVFGIDRFRPLEKRHAVLAVLCLVTAFGIIALDLHYPVRMILGAVFNPSPTSPMWWMGMVYGVYLCILLVEVWSMFSHHPRIHQAACTCATGAALVAPTTLGAVFGVLAARPFWHGIFTPILMTSSAFLAGTSLLGIAFYFVHRYRLAGLERADRLGLPSIRLLMAIGLGIVSILIVRQVIAGLVGSEPGLQEATMALVWGPLAIGFWGLRVVAGLVAPVILLALPATRTPAGTLAASVLALGGVAVDRLLFVAAGEISPTTAISGVVSTPYASYLPSPVEVAIIVGAAALVAFAYTLAERYLDMGESDFHLGLRWAWLGRWRAARRERAAIAAEARVRGAGAR